MMKIGATMANSTAEAPDLLRSKLDTGVTSAPFCYNIIMFEYSALELLIISFMIDYIGFYVIFTGSEAYPFSSELIEGEVCVMGLKLLRILQSNAFA
jgi:hypothetical protein